MPLSVHTAVLLVFSNKALISQLDYAHLEKKNSPKKLRMLIGLKLCFYNLMETQN